MSRRLPSAFVVVLLLAFLFLTAEEGACAFWCGQRLVSEGDTKIEVLNKCGDPDWKEVRREIAYVPIVVGDTTSYVATTIYVEEWAYNLGPQQFIRYLRFENGKVARIGTGDYGY